jgi:ribosomal protein S18 acetylase RimI-like enzyme
MHTRVIQPRRGPAILIRPLERGDTRTVAAVFERLGDASRRARFGGPKPCLSDEELSRLARVDGDHHALVVWVEGDPLPAGIGRLARAGGEVEVAFAVADQHQCRGIGSALAHELLADARAAGITEIVAVADSDNRAALALMRRAADVVQVRLEGPQISIRAALA